jgi:hypothetical protein
MLWAALVTVVAPPNSNLSPISAATNDIITYVLGYGVLGIVSLAFAFRFIVPRGAVAQAREEGRADLLKENARLIDEKRQAEEQRDEALKIANQQILPVAVSFSAAAQSLIPILQTLVAQLETGRQARRRDD